MLRLLAVLLTCVWAFAAQAQNCENVKSGLGVNQKPQNASRDIKGQDLDTIIERGWIEFAVYDDFAPFSKQEGETLAGVDIDVGRLIADELGVEARFRVVAAGENVDADLRYNVWQGALVGGEVANVMLHVPYDHELGCRNEQVVLTGQYFNETLAIAYAKSQYPDGGPVPAFFRYDTVGVENDSIADFYLSGIGNGQIIGNMKRYADYGEAMRGLRDGEVMAVMGPLSQLEAGMDETIEVHQPPLVGLARSKWTLGVAVRMNWRPLGYSVDDAVRAAVEDGRMAAIFEKHGLTYTKPEW